MGKSTLSDERHLSGQALQRKKGIGGWEIPGLRGIQKNMTAIWKVAVGSCFAIILAESIGIQFASSAGIITLLTVLGTKWATVRLSLVRLLTFLVTVFLAWVVFWHISGHWLAYGVFLLLLTAFCYFAGCKDTLSVNAVIGTHFWTIQDFGWESVFNEFCLVLIGISVALIFNLFHGNRYQKRRLIANMRYVERSFQEILEKMAEYLRAKEMRGNVWQELRDLEEYLDGAVKRAWEYQENTFSSHTEYYINYLEMRAGQCHVLHNLHAHIRRIRTMPEQAEAIAGYMVYLRRYVEEMNIPKRQLQELHRLSDEFHAGELPGTREEFEGKAVLYHILMDLEEFLDLKRRFVEKLDDRQRKIYWMEKEEVMH